MCVCGGGGGGSESPFFFSFCYIFQFVGEAAIYSGYKGRHFVCLSTKVPVGGRGAT